MAPRMTLNQPRSFYTVPLAECHLVQEWLDQNGLKYRQFWSAFLNYCFREMRAFLRRLQQHEHDKQKQQ